MQRFFRGLRLSQKIVLPLLAVCLSIFMLGLVVLGHWFTDSLQQNFSQQIESFAERVYQDFQHEQQTLETEIELIVNRDMVNQAVEQRNQGLLLQILLPLKSVLKLDWIKVIDTQGNVVIDLRNNSLSQAKFLDEVITSTASKGGHLIDLVDVEGEKQVLQVVTNGIKSSAGLLGAIIIGNLVDDTLLQKIAVGSSKHLIVQRKNRVVAATLLAAKSGTWQFPPPNLPATRITLEEAFHNGLCPEPIIRISSTQVNENAVVCIADNGTGIPEAIQSLLFDPFFTTKPLGKGTGMGLSISYQIITEKHRGSLRCISSPGQGTEFVITIPIREVGVAVFEKS